MTKSPTRSRGGVVIASCFIALLALVGPLSAGAGAADPAPICPAAPGNARFVRYVYLNILERCPGAAASAYWTAKLDGGGLRWGFAESIDMSNENVGKHNVIPIYQEILGRAPTAAEYKAGFDEIRMNHQDARLLADIYASDGFYAKFKGSTPAARDQAWLKTAYMNILDRAPTAAELTKSAAALGTGGSSKDTRHKVALGLELSNENMQGWTGAVIGAALHRGPKGPAEFGIWYQWLLNHDRQTFRLWTRMQSTNEAYALAQKQENPPPPGEH